MNLSDVIEQRHSVRTFDGNRLTSDELARLNAVVAAASSPFGGKWRAMLACSDGKTFKPSTYGIIRGANTYLLIGCSADLQSLMSVGYAFERVVLEMLSVGISSCWLGGTFRKSSFPTAAEFPADMPLRLVIPFGRAAKHRSVIETLSKAIARSSRRKAADRIFFSESVLYSVEETNCFYKPLMLMRQAPSSLNEQPWRAIAFSGHVDFFCAGTTQLNFVDMGIGLCHFAIGCDEAGIKGEFRTLAEHGDGGEWRYITSFVESSES